jgi:hypothetical protein
VCHFIVRVAAALSGVRAVAGMGWWARHCQGRRAAVPGSKGEVTINMLLGGTCDKARGGGARRPTLPPSETTSLAKVMTMA